MKKLITILMFGVILGGLVAGCSGGEKKEGETGTAGTTGTTGETGGTAGTAGSTTTGG